MTPDQELLRRYAEEDSEAAFGELVQRHLGLVYHAALRLLGGDSHRARDAAQAVFTDVARKASTLSRHPAFASWLHTSTRFAAGGIRRAELTRKKYEVEAETMHALLRADEANDWERLRPVIDEVMAELNERDRSAVLLRYFEGRAFSEIGAALAVSEDAARMRVDRALDRLRTLLGKREIRSSSLALSVAFAQQATIAAPADLAASITSQALASAATVAVGSAPLVFLTLMNTSKITFTALGVALALATSAVFYEAGARQAAVNSLQAVTAEHDANLTALRNAERQSSAVASETKRRRDDLATSRPAEVTSTAPAVDERTQRGNIFMERHPEVRAALQRYADARTDFEFHELYASLNLTAAQIERFRRLIFRGMGNSDSEGQSMSLNAGGNPSSAERTAEFKEILGEDGYSRYIEFSRDKLPREAVIKVAGGLYFTSEPLTPVQSDRLFQAFAQARNPSRQGFGTVYDWEHVIPQAATFLSPAQLEVVKGMEASDKFFIAMNTPPSDGIYPNAGAKLKGNK